MKTKNTESVKENSREEKVKTLRILEIDDMIRSGEYPNATVLEKKFEVSRSTIMRDIDFLHDRYNAPLEYDQQKKGYHYTDSTFFVKSVMLSEGEVFAVSVMEPLLEQYRNTPLESSIKNIIEKIEEFLPKEVTVDSSFVDHDVSFITDPLPKIEEKIFTKLFEAVRTHRTMTFTYRSLSSTEYIEHTADPYHIICQKGSWYMLAYCHEKQDVRTYALSRMKDLYISKTTFRLPPDFNQRKYFDSSFGVWNNRDSPVKIELLFSSEVNTLIMERIWHENQQLEQRKDGSVYLSFESNQMQEVLHMILGFGGKVKVLNPPSLAEQVKEEARKILNQY